MKTIEPIQPMNIFKKPKLPSIFDEDIENDTSLDSDASKILKNHSKKYKQLELIPKKKPIFIKDITKSNHFL